MLKVHSRDILSLQEDALIRSLSISFGEKYAFLIGAGASITSQVPSAIDCIWMWKRDIFLSNNPGIDPQLIDAALPDSRSLIQNWLDSQGIYPPNGSPDEYGFFIETCYPIESDRTKFFKKLMQNAKPHIGYQLLSVLAEAGKLHSVWTTNFDQLVIKAASSFNVSVLEVSRDSISRLSQPIYDGDLLHVSLHGDYRYDSLKNTVHELKDLDAQFRGAMVEVLQDTSLVVIGYSGRDRSVMDTLMEAYSKSGAGRLYWCGYGEEHPQEDRVTQLLSLAHGVGREAYYVNTNGIDHLITRLCSMSLSVDLQKKVKEILSHQSQDAIDSPRFSLPNWPGAEIIKSNAFPIKLPSEIFQFACPQLNGPGIWRKLREVTHGHDIVAAPFKSKVLALGNIDDLQTVFGLLITGGIKRTPVSSTELTIENGIVLELFEKALFRVLAASSKLRQYGRSSLYDPTQYNLENVAGNTCRVHKAVELMIRQYNNQTYLVIIPTVMPFDNEGGFLSVENVKEVRRRILGKQHNSEFNNEVNKWRRTLFARGSTFFFPKQEDKSFVFDINRDPMFANVMMPYGQRTEQSIDLTKYSTLQAVQFAEPKLIFASREGTSHARDVHPIRGLLQNRPLDFSLTRLSKEIRVGIVCPTRDSTTVSRFLRNLSLKSFDSNKDYYIPNYPGFAQAYGVSLTVPAWNDALWASVSESNLGSDIRYGSMKLREQLLTAIDSLCANSDVNVIVIFIPERWKPFESYNLSGERFDLHNFVKAYCVQKGIPTQFLRERTVHKTEQSRIAWWLSLSFYVKSMRVPWSLENHASDTAFMGIGYSIDTIDDEENHIVLGCSHIYRADGIGLRYRLNKIDNPIIRNKSPFMRREDARRLGEASRQLFLQSGQKPKRVVIHKRTPFQTDERLGLLEGLSDIETIDMLEISEEPALRFLSSRVKAGKREGAPFPVRRGTTVVLDSKRAAVFSHGTTEALNPNFNYYLGGNRIPAPLIITRHHGTSDLVQLATEILGLTKMNWNHFDMYSRMPATIQSSREIARIGSLLDRFTPDSFDYRLFI